MLDIEKDNLLKNKIRKNKKEKTKIEEEEEEEDVEETLKKDNLEEEEEEGDITITITTAVQEVKVMIQVIKVFKDYLKVQVLVFLIHKVKGKIDNISKEKIGKI